MEGRLMIEIARRIEKGEKAALVTLIEVEGSSPGKSGSIMGVFEDGSIEGTIGGGNLEYQVVNSALEAIREGKNRKFDFELIEDGELHMKCGGRVKGYVKVFEKRKKLIIIGGGHLGNELYKLGKFLNMYTVIIDDREEYANKKRFPQADELLWGDIGKILEEYSLDEGSYAVIVTRGHASDKVALKAVLEKKLAYIGMIGSRKKITDTYEELVNEGVSIKKLEKVYSPVGLDISSGEPNEIALGIMAEILKVKNQKSGKHMFEVKKVKIQGENL
ncbi:XdhC/CoxI family protein [uncultured Ilyobacter sp.]|uniref:XdhC family protein n=1 Tax=uncultured Ilyobacter sp. TaxID=544433 RepID=UPI002AA85F27|nr:XdhC/CoxI family protein [uncultured Ilyobacter sp.]